MSHRFQDGEAEGLLDRVRRRNHDVARYVERGPQEVWTVLEDDACLGKPESMHAPFKMLAVGRIEGLTSQEDPDIMTQSPGMVDRLEKWIKVALVFFADSSEVQDDKRPRRYFEQHAGLLPGEFVLLWKRDSEWDFCNSRTLQPGFRHAQPLSKALS